MEKLLNADFWKKAYLLEFKLNGILTDAFTFSVPPESEEFSFPQRKGETKTFGGVVVSDYGNDLVQIQLSGSTINQELKLIYKSSLGTAEMTGQQEAFYLRDLLKKYGKRDNLKNKEVYLYSLNGGDSKTSHNPKWWQIYIGQLDLTRSKEKPFCYNYKFIATGNPEINRKITSNEERKYKWIGSKIDDFSDFMLGEDGIITNLRKWSSELNSLGSSYIEELNEYINTLNSCIDSFESSVDSYVTMVNTASEKAALLTIDTISLGEKVISVAKRIYPVNVISTIWNNCLSLVAACKSVYDYCANIGENQYSQNSWKNITALYDDDVTDLDIADIFSSCSWSILKNANKARAVTSKFLNNNGVAVIPGEQDEDDKIVMTYGYKVIAINDAETSWDQIAHDYYGDSSLSTLIAVFNNSTVKEQLKAGQSVLIPNLNYAENKTLENEIYNTIDTKDNYGKDLLIKNNDYVVINGDLAVVGGVNNLEQALTNRYSTLIGARIRNEVYGIQANIGDAVKASSALIEASVHQTTVEDPRIDSIEDINFIGDGDKLYVSVIYIDKNGIKRNFGRTIQ